MPREYAGVLGKASDARMGPLGALVFSVVFVVAGALAMLLPLIAPGLQGNNPVWVNILLGAVFIIVGIGVLQFERGARSIPFWAGLMSVVLGGFVMIMAGFSSDNSGFHAPRWVVAAAGATFLLAGLAVMKSGSAAGDASRPGEGMGHALIIAMLLTCFGAVASWIAFAPGEIVGRILLSPGALLLDVMAAAAWFHFFRRLVQRMSRKEGAEIKRGPSVRP